MLNLSNANPRRQYGILARAFCAGLLFICSFFAGCRSEHIINTDDEFQHLYSVTSGPALSKGDRSEPSKQWAVGIKEDWQFDINGSDPEYLNQIRAKLPEYTVVAQTDRTLVLSRQFDGDAVTVIVESEPSGTGSRIHVRVVAGPD
jgi:hypothetical protein